MWRRVDSIDIKDVPNLEDAWPMPGKTQPFSRSSGQIQVPKNAAETCTDTHTHKLINQNHPTPRSPPNQLNIFQNQAARIPIGNRSTCHYKIDTLYIVCEILNIKHEIWYMVYYILNMIDYTLNIINPNYIYTYMFHMRYKPFYYIHCMLYMINYEKLLQCTE